MAHDPVVFISSTCEDLKDYRDQASRAASANRFSPRMLEYFPASGHCPSLQACRDEVAEAEVVVVIVAHRYGWVPDDPSNPDFKSITWLECEHARSLEPKREVLAFFLDPAHPWPAELRESYRLVTDRNKSGILDEVNRNEASLSLFKQELSFYTRATFTDPSSLRAEVATALADWSKRKRPATAAVHHQDPEAYLRWLEDDTRQIRIKGLKTKRAEPYFFGIDEIYIPLTTLARSGERGAPHAHLEQNSRQDLEQVLHSRRIVIVGDPGSGKSTFLRRIAFRLARNQRGSGAATDKRFPLLVRCADLASFLSGSTAAKPSDAAAWLPAFLGHQSEAYNWGVGEAFFENKLKAGGCLLLFDGLDEAPERTIRERIARILERSTKAFDKCDFLVTTRPNTNTGDAMVEGFDSFHIDKLERPEIAAFFEHFSVALELNATEKKAFIDQLEFALDQRPEIREMAANPVMLTALAVLQHNDQRLPEHRVDLYGSILGWLASAHEYIPGRPPAEKCLEAMRKLALHMQDSPAGRLVQINKRDAAVLLAPEFGTTIEAAEARLESETNDTGIISSVGTDLKFWHLSFQEYLAAREIAGLAEKDQGDLVLKDEKLYSPEWRETMRLLAALVRQQGKSKIEGLFVTILANTEQNLKGRVKTVALLSSMMRDLSRMDYVPETAEYERTVSAVMGIFETGEAEKIPIAERADAADLLGKLDDPRLHKDNMVVIPGGTFYMGANKMGANKMGASKTGRRNADPEAYDDESPVHKVTLKPFRMGRYPVTVQEYAAFMEAGGYKTPAFWHPGWKGEYTAPEDWEEQKEFRNRAVIGVCWYEADAWCRWKGLRLPGEAEWERAARGPGSTRYPWGEKPPLDPTFANYWNAELRRVTPVGLFPKGKSTEGLCDMLGNVWEWCSDWFGAYSAEDQTDPPGPDSGDGRILRGGSWVNNPQGVRVSNRYRGVPSYRSYITGFRCAGELS